MSSAGVSLFRIWEERNRSVEERRVLWLRRVRAPGWVLFFCGRWVFVCLFVGGMGWDGMDGWR